MRADQWRLWSSDWLSDSLTKALNLISFRSGQILGLETLELSVLGLLRQIQTQMSICGHPGATLTFTKGALEGLL